MKSVAVLLGMSLLIAESVQAGVPDLAGEQFQVNTYTTGNQWTGEVSTEAQGSFVVVWMSAGSYGTDTSAPSIQAQLFDADGTREGTQFQVNTYTTGSQWYCAVATNPQGRFMVVWGSDGSFGTDTSSYSIQAQLYEVEGSAVGGQFQVNTYTTGRQWQPKVAADPQGNFIVVWSSSGSHGTDASGDSVQAQVFDAFGVPMGGQIQVNTHTVGDQFRPAVATDAQSDFVVVWQSDSSNGSDTSSYSIQARRFEADATPVGEQFQVNAYTTDRQWDPKVAKTAPGDFVVTWTSLGSYGSDTSSDSIQARHYEADGTPVGGQFQVNSYTTGDQWRSAVATDVNGNFVVAWQSDSSGGTDKSSYSIHARRFDAGGVPVGGQFQVNTYTTRGQVFPAVATDDQGRFVVVWRSLGSAGTDVSGSSVQARRSSIGGAIFQSGFESGDTSSWWSAVPPPGL